MSHRRKLLAVLFQVLYFTSATLFICGNKSQLVECFPLDPQRRLCPHPLQELTLDVSGPEGEVVSQ